MKTKIVLITSWVVTVAFFALTVIIEHKFLNSDYCQLASAFLACVSSIFGYQVLPAPLQVFLKKLIMFIFRKKKAGDVAYFNDQADLYDKDRKGK